ncbi:hypothetical protein [Streptomyces sp. NPDC050287]|uniref:hypothetical protein n=1 Tax=Streptomyces sp. NPDC050287 TaxID=3365608 RepID=UPI00379E2EE7
MTLLALLVPALMMAFLLAMDALEDLLFPRPKAADDERTQADGGQHARSPDSGTADRLKNRAGGA